MANDIIQKHNFELAKGRILSASKNVPSTVSLNRFPTEGSIFSWNDHNITGKEANSLLVTPLQQTLISQNGGIKELFNIAKDVYNALDSLDNEYIAGIVGAVEAAKLASNQAKTASSQAKQASEQALDASIEALDASEKAKVAQADIKRTIEALQKTVSILKDFKADVTIKLNTLTAIPTKIVNIDSQIKNIEQSYKSVIQATKGIQSVSDTLNSISHLKDIDTIWKDLQSNKSSLGSLVDIVMPFMENINRADKEIRDGISSIENALQAIIHLNDVDTIWNDVEGHKANLADFHQQVDTFIEKATQTTEHINNDIDALQQYRMVLESYQHLGDVDAIWNDVEGHKANLADFHQQVDTFIEKVNQTTERINNDIAALQQYRTVLESYQHLGDVDAIWNDVEGHKIDIGKIQEKLDSFITEVRITTDEIKESIKKQEKVNSDAHFRFEKRIKTAYYIGGSAVGLSLVNYLLQILGIL